MKVGQKIKMCSEVQRYTVQGFTRRFVIATKPFNAGNTYLYTLIDLQERVRGPLNSLFGPHCDVDSPAGAQELFEWIEDNGGFAVGHVSHRRRMPLTEPELAQLQEQKR